MGLGLYVAGRGRIRKNSPTPELHTIALADVQALGRRADAHGILKVGRNAEAFLENASGMRWYKTLSGGTHGILKVETSQDLNSLPLEGKVPTEWGNEVES